MKNFLLLSLICFQFLSYGQDLDIYNIKQDDKLKIPSIPYGMTVDEFQLLSRNLRMKDMLYAMVVPGYVHFHAKEIKTGYWLLGTRVSGFMGLTWIGLDSHVRMREFMSFNFEFDPTIGANRIKVYGYVATVSMIFIFGTYFYDWIHGQYKLAKKQDNIRYRYGLKLKIENLQSSVQTQSNVTSLSLTLNF